MSANEALKLLKAGKVEQAQTLCLNLLRANPRDINAHHLLGCALMNQQRFPEAQHHLEQALMLARFNAEILHNYACCLMLQGQYGNAEKNFRNAAALNPKRAETWNNIGYCSNMQGNLEGAEPAYRKALEIEPGKVETWCNLANLRKDMGDFRGALHAYEKAEAANPKFIGVYRGQLLAQIYLDDVPPAEMFSRIQRLGEKITKGIAPLPPKARPQHQKIRVGWHTSDLYKTHPVARNLLPFFDSPREGLAYYLYLDVKTPDATTNWFASKADLALNVLGTPDKVLAERIQSDEIDVMIYLAGRFDDNRPQIAAYRPAPVNVSMFDVATSGIPGMDYFVVDEAMVSPEEQFTEKLLALPNVYVHEPIPVAPPVAPAPRLQNGFPTFGCFNNPVKISDRTLALWGQILREVPDARLMLHYKAVYRLEGVVNRIMKGLGDIGDLPRVIFSTVDTPSEHHLARYAQIDVALDPFPMTGSTTTFEALHQGVPVVTLQGDTVLSRWSAAMVGKVAAGFVADSEAHYVEIAVNAAKGKPIDREWIRRKLLASPICQPAGTVKAFEAAISGLTRP
jgi:protein O-GlcNAc transferase